MKRNQERTLAERVSEVDECCVDGKVYMYDIDGKIYVGSTIQPLTYRDQKHKYHAYTETSPKHNYPLYQHIRASGYDWDDIEIVLLENYPCKNKWFLRQQERKWYEILNATLNTRIPNHTDKEWRDKNSEDLAIKVKNRPTNQKERYAKRREQELAYKRQQYQDNPDYYKIKRREQYELHKETICKKIEERGKQPTPCLECGKVIRKDSIKKHMKAVHSTE